MENITIIEIESRDGDVSEHVIIDKGNGEFTSMPKSEYDRLQAEHFTPNLAE